MSKNWVVTKINKKFFLRVGTKVFKCQIGKSGYKIYTKKQEGDQATPIGKWRLKSIYYRSDKVLRPKVKNKTFKINKITKNCGWCDDPKSSCYNKYINLNKNYYIKNFNFEKLWRDDQAYDLVIETSCILALLLKVKEAQYLYIVVFQIAGKQLVVFLL